MPCAQGRSGAPVRPRATPGLSTSGREVLDDGARQHAASAARRASGLDRAAEERATPGLLEHARADAATRVLVLNGDAAPLAAAGRPALGRRRRTCRTARSGRSSVAAPTAAALLAAVFAAQRRRARSPRRRAGRRCAPSAARCRRAEAGAFVEALSLGRWLLEAPFCPACGARTEARATPAGRGTARRAAASTSRAPIPP